MGVSLDRDPPEKLQKFVKKHDIRFPIVLDAGYEVAQKYGVRGTPTSYLISGDGKVIGGTTGPQQWGSDTAAKIIQQLLKNSS